MYRMNFISTDLFAFVGGSSLKSRFKGVKKLSSLMDIVWQDEAVSSIQPEVLFNRLVKSPIDLSLIQVFALMGWDDHQWKTKNGKIAMKNWWLSVLLQEKHGDSTLKKMMVLRSILADTERYPAPTDLIQLMRETLQKLLYSNEWADQKKLRLLQALLSEDAKDLAKYALVNRVGVYHIMAEAGYPTKLPIIQEANVQWLDQWVSEPTKQRQSLRKAFNEILNVPLSLDQKYQFAQIVLNHIAFSDQIEYLKLEVKNFPELVTWLSTCARQREFKSKLSLGELNRLNCWIGTGNYEALREILMDLAKSTDDQQDEKRTDSRYIFWHSYQALFQEAWLLLPSQYFQKNKSNLTNIKEIQGTEHATIVLKLNDYYIFQYFLGKASQINLLVTKDVKWVEGILNRKLILNRDLLQLNLLLIHDHEYKWQSDLAFTLEQHFNIQPEKQRIRYPTDQGGYGFSCYHKDVKNPKTQQARKQAVSRWLHNNVKNQFVPEIYNKAALTAKRYDLLD